MQKSWLGTIGNLALARPYRGDIATKTYYDTLSLLAGTIQRADALIMEERNEGALLAARTYEQSY